MFALVIGLTCLSSPVFAQNPAASRQSATSIRVTAEVVLPAAVDAARMGASYADSLSSGQDPTGAESFMQATGGLARVDREPVSDLPGSPARHTTAGEPNRIRVLLVFISN